jgi:uncharacterized protein
MLRELREKQGLSIEEISNTANIRTHIILALEDKRVEEFPAKVYLRGFLNKYLSFLDISEHQKLTIENEYLSLWDEKMEEKPSEKKRPKSLFWQRNLSILLILLILGVTVAAFFNILKKKEDLWGKKEEVFQKIIIPPTRKIGLKKGIIYSSPLKKAKAQKEASPTSFISKPVSKLKVCINTKNNLELKALIDNKQQQNFLLHKGSELHFNNIEDNLLIKVSSLEGLYLKVNNKPISLPQGEGSQQVPYQIIIKKDEITVSPLGTFTYLGSPTINSRVN